MTTLKFYNNSSFVPAHSKMRIGLNWGLIAVIGVNLVLWAVILKM